MTIVTWCPLVDSSPGRLLQPPHQAHWNPMRPIILLTIFTKTRTQLHHAPAADLSLGLSCLLQKMGIIILTWPGYPEPLGKQTERYVRRVSMGLRRPQTKAWEGTRTLSLTGPCGSVPSVVAAPWRQYPSAGGSRTAQNAPGQPPGHEKAAIQGWLGQEPGDERQEPCAPQRKEASSWPPHGPSCQAGRPYWLTGEGEARERKTKLVFEAQGLKGGCVCPSQPPGGRRCESLVAWGEGQPSCPGRGGTMPILM